MPRRELQRKTRALREAHHDEPLWWNPLLLQFPYPMQVVNPFTREEVVAEMRRRLDVAGVPADAVVTARAGDASATIVDESVGSSADLIVMGTHGRRGFKRLLLGSVTETVLREAPCPVLTMPPRAPADSARVVVFKRILCPIDFSPSSLQALGFALDLARQSNGTVTLLNVRGSWPKNRAHGAKLTTSSGSVARIVRFFERPN
jgi:nucleotide-binding universal stress UspA family protein